MNTIELADGSKFEGDVGYDGRDARMKLTSETARERFLDFLDPSKTSVITYYYGLYHDVYHGFDRMLFVEPRNDGLFNVWFGASDGAYVETQLTNVPDEYLPQ